MINPAQPLCSRSDVMLSIDENQAPEAPDSGQSSEAAESGATKTRVLIVEDDGEIRAALHDALDDLGYDVLEEPDAERALITLGRSDFDAVLVDVRMPGMG